MLYEFGDYNLKDKFAPVWARQETPASRSAPPAHFSSSSPRRMREARGAKPYARLTNVVADLAQRKQPGEVTRSLEALWNKLGVLDGNGALITGATGAEPVTSEEKAFLSQHSGFCGARDRHDVRPHAGNPVSAGSGAGGAFDLARRIVSAQRSRPGWRLKCPKPPTQIVVVGAGHWQGEGMALVEAIE